MSDFFQQHVDTPGKKISILVVQSLCINPGDLLAFFRQDNFSFKSKTSVKYLVFTKIEQTSRKPTSMTAIRTHSLLVISPEINMYA